MEEIEIVGEIKQIWFKEIKGYNSRFAIWLCLGVSLFSNEGFNSRSRFAGSLTIVHCL